MYAVFITFYHYITDIPFPFSYFLQKKRTPFTKRPVLCQFIFFPLLFFPGLFCRPARNPVKKFIPRGFHFIL